ncbi:HAD-IIB family hydrolase [Aidingimonas halophila]|uniref:Mannosyl-3-phosphoglycerate phosphatase n=1 Tax=Aidingimonas halophila TaxID=574349 RepID=A0A1H2RZ81_9GAMM|nr:HAD hydrolase family protein [Aidingimonas halophila]GHC18483.1 mannosyl-3-phosphoglycerate phosphatase [Aidingimonas halophila]SDW24782.1 mannosyl-3-phosphoglycerate phosphatase [Aidingimonas halophila]
MFEPTATSARLVFTDLDGSLLDHDSYDWQPAHPWLERLRFANVPVIPVSSKTRAELLALRVQLGLEQSPFIAENGAVIGLPPAWQHARLDRDPDDIGSLCVKTPGLDIGFIRKRLEVIRERQGLSYCCMGEMSLEDIMAVTGLSEPQARQARLREGSEPVLWQDDDALISRFRDSLDSDGMQLTRGGRFWHVMGHSHKGSAVGWLIDRFRALRGQRPHTLALGDGPNDIPMLQRADLAVLIPGRHGQVVSLEGDHVYHARSPGPAGWSEGMDHWWGETLPDNVSGEESPA